VARIPELQAHNLKNGIAQDYQALADALYRALADALRQARGHLNKRASQRRQERPDSMPMGLALPELLGLPPAGGALVVPLVTSKGTAIFVLPQGTQAVDETRIPWLDSFTQETLD
jgi:hypothetical protein